MNWNSFSNQRPLNERLGFHRDDRLLIVNADDAGMCPEANAAILEVLTQGLATSSTVMMPGPAAEAMIAACRQNPALDLGIHLTHTGEWPECRWQPLAAPDKVPGLCRPDGTLWPDVEAVYAHSNSGEAYREGKAQVDRALALGLQPTHLDSHMGVMQKKLSYFLQYIRLAWQYRLPLRMPSAATLAPHHGGFLRKLAGVLGLVMPDELMLVPYRPEQSVKEHWLEVLRQLRPGVTEIYIHPMQPDQQVKGTARWQRRRDEYRLFLRDPELQELLETQHITRIGYRALYQLQRGIKRQ